MLDESHNRLCAGKMTMVRMSKLTWKNCEKNYVVKWIRFNFHFISPKLTQISGFEELNTTKAESRLKELIFLTFSHANFDILNPWNFTCMKLIMQPIERQYSINRIVEYSQDIVLYFPLSLANPTIRGYALCRRLVSSLVFNTFCGWRTTYTDNAGYTGLLIYIW